MANKQERAIQLKSLSLDCAILETKTATIFVSKCTGKIDRGCFSRQDFSNFFNQYKTAYLGLDISSRPVKGIVFFNSFTIIV